MTPLLLIYKVFATNLQRSCMIVGILK